jgi:hypothetical protein
MDLKLMKCEVRHGSKLHSIVQWGGLYKRVNEPSREFLEQLSAISFSRNVALYSPSFSF